MIIRNNSNKYSNIKCKIFKCNSNLNNSNNNNTNFNFNNNNNSNNYTYFNNSNGNFNSNSYSNRCLINQCHFNNTITHISNKWHALILNITINKCMCNINKMISRYKMKMISSTMRRIRVKMFRIVLYIIYN